MNFRFLKKIAAVFIAVLLKQGIAHAALLNGVDWPTAPGVYVLLEGDTKPVHIDTIVSEEVWLHSQATIAEKIVALTQKKAIKQINFANNLSVLNGSAVKFRVLVANEKSGDGTTHGHLGQSYQCSSSYWKDVHPSYGDQGYCIIDFGGTPIKLYNDSGAAYEITLRFFKQVHDDSIPGLLRDEELMESPAYTFVSSVDDLAVNSHTLDQSSVAFNLTKSDTSGISSNCDVSKEDCFGAQEYFSACAGTVNGNILKYPDTTNKKCIYQNKRFNKNYISRESVTINASGCDYASPELAKEAARKIYVDGKCTTDGEYIKIWTINTESCYSTYQWWVGSYRKYQCVRAADIAVNMPSDFLAEPNSNSSAFLFMDLDKINTDLVSIDTKTDAITSVAGPIALSKIGDNFVDFYDVVEAERKTINYTIRDFFGRSVFYQIIPDLIGPYIITNYVNDKIMKPIDLIVGLSDNKDINPTLVSVEITGGPNNISQSLQIPEMDQSGRYIFPMTDIEYTGNSTSYNLKITAVDSFGNESIFENSFTYNPDYMYVLEDQEIIQSESTVYKSNDLALYQIPIANVGLGEGVLVKGVGVGDISLTADSAGPIYFDNRAIYPGEKIEIDFELDPENGVNGVPVHSLKTDPEGQLKFDFLLKSFTPGATKEIQY
jgi:hypothetical protein